MKILIRADASQEIGIGHIMRTYALAQTFIETGDEVTFLCFKLPRSLEMVLAKDSIEVIRSYDYLIGSDEDIRITADISRSFRIDWVIADGYSFDGQYQKRIKEQGVNLMIIDDYGHANSYSADIVLNPGVNPDPNLYQNRASKTILLLGPKFTPLRREFLQIPRCPKEIAPRGKKVLITMGGSDPLQITRKVIDSLKQISGDLEITVVTGPAYHYTHRLKDADNEIQSQILLLHDVNDMAALMSWADVGISAGGTTLAEMAYMGLPSIILKTADNQSASKYYAEIFGTSVYLGDADEIGENRILYSVISLLNNPLQRQLMSENGRRMVDGKGSLRIYDILLERSNKA